jgi:iron complex outermembrane receptor protein
LPDYDLANFRLDWDGINGSKFGASAFITNAFDKTYYTGGLALGSVLGLNAAIPGMPRMYGVEVRMSY